MKKNFRWAAALAAMAACATATAQAESFREPPVFASKNGVLDIMMIAKPKPIRAIEFKPPGMQNPINPTGVGVRDLLSQQGCE